MFFPKNTVTRVKKLTVKHLKQEMFIKEAGQKCRVSKSVILVFRVLADKFRDIFLVAHNSLL